MTLKHALLGLLGAAVVGAGGYAAYQHWAGPDRDRTLTLYGNVDIREVELGFRVAGRLNSMRVEEGDPIKPGDLLATLDDRPQRESLAVAEAGVQEARAHLERARTGTRPQEIQQAEAVVDEAEAALENFERELARQRELTEAQLSSQQRLDSAIARRDQGAARLDAAREALALAVEGTRREDITAAEAALAAAEARRDQARTSLGDTRLFSPSPGTILTRVREPGAMVGVGATVYTLSLTDTVYVRAYVDEPRLGLLAPGTEVLLHTDTDTRVYRGRIGFISPRAEFTPKTVETPELRTDLVYRLRIVVPEADAGLRQGMPVSVEIPGA